MITLFKRNKAVKLSTNPDIIKLAGIADMLRKENASIRLAIERSQLILKK